MYPLKNWINLWLSIISFLATISWKIYLILPLIHFLSFVYNFIIGFLKCCYRIIEIFIDANLRAIKKKRQKKYSAYEKIKDDDKKYPVNIYNEPIEIKDFQSETNINRRIYKKEHFTTKQQLLLLEHFNNVGQTLNSFQLKKLAELCGSSPKKVSIWFTNKRYYNKKSNKKCYSKTFDIIKFVVY